MTLTLCESQNKFSTMSLRCLSPEILVQMTKTKFQIQSFKLNFRSEKALTARLKNRVSGKKDEMNKMLIVK